MGTIKKWLLGTEKHAIRDGAIWNLIYSMEYSLLSAVLMLIITRTSGLYDAGIFMIAYTVTQMMATIGSYGMRSFQVSDVKNQYNFSTYYASRIASVIAMVVICLGYSVLQGYDGQRMTVIVWLCVYRLIEDVEDVFHGEMQKKQRLDIASRIPAIRILISTVCFIVVFIGTKSLVWASAILTISSAIISIAFTVWTSKPFEEISLKTEWRLVPKLLLDCLPLCVGGYLYNYLVNAPKYAIDRNLSEETQTFFNILFMPIFVINMLSSFVFKPLIAKMGILWHEKKVKELAKLFLQQVLVIVAITIIVIIGGMVIGLDILGWMYGVSLGGYRGFFAMLVVFGGFAALGAFLVVALTVVRKQGTVIVAYIVATIVDMLFIDKFVKAYNIWGAGIMYGVAMLVVLLVLSSVLITTMLKEAKNG